MKKVFFIVGVLFICYGCQPRLDFVVRDHQNLEKMQWLSSHQLDFPFEITDTIKPYWLGFYIRYTNDFPDANIYLFVHTTFPDGTEAADTISIDLFRHDGTPYGVGKQIKEMNVSVSEIVFPQRGTYHIKIEQGTRRDTLCGIASMGIYVVEPTKKKE